MDDNDAEAGGCGIILGSSSGAHVTRRRVVPQPRLSGINLRTMFLESGPQLRPCRQVFLAVARTEEESVHEHKDSS